MNWTSELIREWNNAVRIVNDWAAHKGLVTALANDDSIDRQWAPKFLSVMLNPRPDSIGITMAKPTVAQLMVRRFEDPDGRELMPPQIVVRLVRHGRGEADSVEISPYELERFTLEVHHLDRIG